MARALAWQSPDVEVEAERAVRAARAVDGWPLGAALVGAPVAALAAWIWHDLDASPALILAALFVGAVVPFLVVETWRHGVTSPAVLFVVGLAYYHVVIPIEYLVDPNLPRSFLYEYGMVSARDLVTPLVATDAALLAFLVGYAYTRRRGPAAEYVIDPKRLTRFAAIFAAVGIAMYLTMSLVATGSLFGIFNASYRDRDELFFGLGSLGVGLQLVYLGASALGILWLSRRGLLGMIGAVAILALMGLHTFLVGSKMHVFHVGIAVLVGARVAGWRIRASALLLVAVLLIPLLFVGLTRNRLGQGVEEMAEFAADEADAESFNPANLDAYGPYLTLIYTTANLRVPADLKWGGTYLQILTLMPPRWMYPGRPTPIADEFAMEFLGKDYYDNAGFGYSSVTEAYVNFGAVGPPLVFVLIGLGFGALRDALERRRGQLAAAIVYATGAPWILLTLRYPLSGVAKGYGLMMLVPTLALVWLGRRRGEVVG
ncbi:MAG TPA: O-antigen polysaccharide polymerase Wzy [Polyangia bacterium]|nr:O-antigen polysaccharide polymerase Wzy [Polyangia bacterium]